MRPNSSEIAKILRKNIKRHHYDNNERLPSEREMSETFGASRNTIRSALKVLADEKLLDIRQGSGAYVRYDNDNSLADNVIFENASPIDLIGARMAMEPHICRLAALNARKSGIDELQRLLEVMEAAEQSPEKFSKADTEFHSALARLSGNMLIRWFMEQINIVRGQQQWKTMRHLTLNPEAIAIYNQHHRDIFQAIKNRSPEDAAIAMKIHLKTAHDSIKKFI